MAREDGSATLTPGGAGGAEVSAEVSAERSPHPSPATRAPALPEGEGTGGRGGTDGGLRLLTPERVGLDLATAGIGSRCAALLLDTIVQTVLNVLALGAVGLVFYAYVRVSGDFDSSSAGVPVALWIFLAVVLVLLFLTTFGYFILFEIVWNGQTPGKRALGLRVMRENGYPVRPGDAVVRNLMRIVDALPGGYAIGLLSMLLSRRSKRVGDFAAGTIVVREAPARLAAFSPLASPPNPPLASPPGFPPVGTAAPAAPLAPADAPAAPSSGDSSGDGPSGVASAGVAGDVPYQLPPLEGAHSTLVRDFLLRRGSLDAPARAQLAHRLAGSMAARYGLQELHTTLGDEAFLERLPV